MVNLWERAGFGLDCSQDVSRDGLLDLHISEATVVHDGSRHATDLRCERLNVEWYAHLYLGCVLAIGNGKVNAGTSRILELVDGNDIIGIVQEEKE